ncbi:MAG TPA: hypothetical protein EYP98_00925, partial [Planctomycetes bacterium]|nr:hypothetical protein [Planctomycetota bacterium]
PAQARQGGRQRRRRRGRGRRRARRNGRRTSCCRLRASTWYRVTFTSPSPAPPSLRCSEVVGSRPRAISTRKSSTRPALCCGVRDT